MNFAETTSFWPATSHNLNMTHKPLPFTAEQIQRAAERFPTPFHLYDERTIRESARAFFGALGRAPGLVNYFAVKATPTPRILSILTEEGCGLDCSSLAELVLAERVGLRDRRVMFSSNNTPPEEFRAALGLGALINLDDIGLLDVLAQQGRLPETLCFRYNPGPLRTGNAIIGRPEEAKFGCTREQLFEGYAAAQALGVRRFGLHTMVASNELDPDYFVATGRMLFELAAEIQSALGIRLEFVNLGGGIGIPYRPGQAPVDLERVSAGLQSAYEEFVVPARLDPLQICFECGRLLTGPSAALITRVRHLKQTYKRYIGVDACMADLMRPGIYGAYHHISAVHAIGAAEAGEEQIADVVGSLCENNDKFAIDRLLPNVAPGDLLAIHDTGAHGRAMGFNYNGKLRSAEVLLREDGELELIRRAETLEDYFATLIFS
jgi:diaminopimelate decarboxylase